MEKKKKNHFLSLLSILFIIFAAYMVAYNSGYYEANISRKSRITEEKLQEFERDVKDGKEIDIKNYVENEYVDYSSSLSKLGNRFSSSIDTFMDSGLSDFFEFLGKLFV